MAMHANKRFLSEIVRSGAIASETSEIGDERLAPGIHESVES
jgi:hypothetical protein